jgi:hypothetical protein
MNELPSLFTPTRARSESVAPAPAPERRASDVNGADFARSLASVRKVDRSAAGPDRTATPRAGARTTSHADDCCDTDGAKEKGAAAGSRAQVQALMLSGAMKFAAARSTESDTSASTTVVAATGKDATESSADLSLVGAFCLPADMAESCEASSPFDGCAAPEMAAKSKIAQWVPPTDLDADERVPGAAIADVTGASEELTGSAAATAAAMQLIATLPIAEPMITVDDASVDTMDTATPTSEFDNVDNDDAARAAWSRRLAAMQPAATDAMLVEDHFDTPASAATPSPATATSAAVPRDVVPSPVTVADANAAAKAVTDAMPATAPKPVTKRGEWHGVERDVEQLAPEFRERLQKVMERMKQEFGHDVTVLETVRSPERQAALFAQGRSAPGPVVTWTRNSKHSKGLAADLMVDGKWDNPAGYAHLAQIAKQEGLRTLGARDPGHLELPADGAVSAETLGTLLSDLGGDVGDEARRMRAEVDAGGRDAATNAMARVADVAQVARVSQVSQVARVATVARPGAASARAEQGGGGDAVSPLAVNGPVPQFMTDGTSAMRLATPVGNVDMADRISHLMDLQASQSAKPLHSVLLRMENANGIEDQIRIDTRGTSVDAQLGLGTAQQAAEMSGRVSELRDALERRGLTADGLRVQAAPRTGDSVNFTRMMAPVMEVAQMRAAADAQAHGDSREQSAREQQHREAMAREQERQTSRSSSDDARHRSRREQPETRQ